MKIYGYVRVSTMKQNIERQIRNIKAKYPEAIIVEDSFTGTKLDRPGWNKIYSEIQKGKIKKGDKIVFDSVSRMSRDADEGFEVYEELYSKGIDLYFLKEPHINTEIYREAAERQIKLEINSGDPDADELVSGMVELFNKYNLALAKKQIRIAFEQSEKEVEDLHQRTKEGIETARLKGKQIGAVEGSKLDIQKRDPAKAIIKQYSKDFDGDLSDNEVMAILATKQYEHIAEERKRDKSGNVAVVSSKKSQKSLKLARNTYYKYKREIKAEL